MSIDLNDLYASLFRREPDPAGQSYWDVNAPRFYEESPYTLQAAMIQGASPEDRAAYETTRYDIGDMYGDLFGREADPLGHQFWREQAPGIVAANGTDGLRSAMIRAAVPTDAAAYMRSQHGGMNLYGPEQHQDWSGYMGRAAQQDRGINNMPFAFSDYGSLAGQTPEQVQGTMFRSPDDLTALLSEISKSYGTQSGFGGLAKPAEKPFEPEMPQIIDYDAMAMGGR